MATLEDLTGIKEHKKESIVECLDKLITLKDENHKLLSYITGYNWYNKLMNSKRMVTFSNIHETKEYKQDMLRDLIQIGYNKGEILNFIRTKTGAFLWNPKFRTRKDDATLLPGLKIKNISTKEYIDLIKFPRPLINYPEFSNLYGQLIAEDKGWELDIPFNSESELIKLTELFLLKSGLSIYDENGNEIEENEEARKLRNPWRDAYETPLLIIGEGAVKYASKLPHFENAFKICLKENRNEISFIVHNKYPHLKKLKEYENLINLGFKEEICLGNKPFLKYLDNR